MRASAAFALLLMMAAPAAAETPVYRVDQATAVVEGDHLVISARGAVRSGGWENPRLLVLKSAHQGRRLDLIFTANPPQDPSVVIQALLPVRVSLKTRLPKGSVAAVHVMSETNAVTAEIIPKFDRQKTAARYVKQKTASR